MSNPLTDYILSRLKLRRNMIGVIAPESRKYRYYSEFVDEVQSIINEWQEMRELDERGERGEEEKD